VNWRGEYFQVDSARLWDLPDVPVGIGVDMEGVQIGGETQEKFLKEVAEPLLEALRDAAN